MEDLGRYFLELRQKRGLNYEEIFDEIKINEEQIKAIEEDRLFDLGNYGMVRALVFNYARFLEADLSAVMAELKIMMPEHTKKDFTPRKTLKEKKILLSTNFLWTVGILVIAAILGSILLYSYRQGLLVTPEFFVRNTEKEQTQTSSDPAPELPDTLRIRMRMLSEGIPTHTVSDSSPATNPLGDNADYIGEILGESPVNVQIN